MMDKFSPDSPLFREEDVEDQPHSKVEDKKARKKAERKAYKEALYLKYLSPVVCKPSHDSSTADDADTVYKVPSPELKDNSNSVPNNPTPSQSKIVGFCAERKGDDADTGCYFPAPDTQFDPTSVISPKPSTPSISPSPTVKTVKKIGQTLLNKTKAINPNGDVSLKPLPGRKKEFNASSKIDTSCPDSFRLRCKTISSASVSPVKTITEKKVGPFENKQRDIDATKMEPLPGRKKEFPNIRSKIDRDCPTSFRLCSSAKSRQIGHTSPPG